MNLIGHYLCASKTARPYRLGSVLPDLLGIYRRKLRPKALEALWDDAATTKAETGSMLAGMEFHHEVDVHFHRAPLFTEASTALRIALAESSDTPGLKRFLPAHVLTELLLDHLILARHPVLAHNFHEDLAAGRHALAEMVCRHPLGEPDSFHTFLNRVLDDRFVEDYHSLEGIMARMNRILPRFGQRTLEPREQAAVADWFGTAAEVMDQRQRIFVDDMVSRSDRHGSAGEIVQPLEAPGKTSSGKRNKTRPRPALVTQPA